MLENNTYNLITQLVEESQSLWRIKNNYHKDVVHCDKCHQVWDMLEKQKEENVKILEELVKNHI